MTRSKRIVTSIFFSFYPMHTCDTKSLHGGSCQGEKKPWCVPKAERSEGQLDARRVGALVGFRRLTEARVMRMPCWPGSRRKELFLAW